MFLLFIFILNSWKDTACENLVRSIFFFYYFQYKNSMFTMSERVSICHQKTIWSECGLEKHRWSQLLLLLHHPNAASVSVLGCFFMFLFGNHEVCPCTEQGFPGHCKQGPHQESLPGTRRLCSLSLRLLHTVFCLKVKHKATTSPNIMS